MSLSVDFQSASDFLERITNDGNTELKNLDDRRVEDFTTNLTKLAEKQIDLSQVIFSEIEEC